MDELLAQISQNPDAIDEFTAEQVTEAREAIAEFVTKVRSKEIEAEAEALDEAKVLGEKLTARAEAIATTEAEMEAKLAELETSLGITTEEVEEIVAEEIEETEATEEVEEAPVVEEEPEPVTASAKPSIGALSKAMPKDRKPAEKSPYTLVASAGQHEGQEYLTASAFGDTALHRWNRMGNERIVLAELNDLRHKYEVRKGDDEHNEKVFAAIAADAAASVSLDAVLTASGGFCAPPEVLYGFFNIATRAGILALPTVNAPRGSISLPVSPSLGDFLGQSGIATEWTNENDEAGSPSPATKPVYVFECPEFQECEVAAWPTILQFGNFVGRFYPEAVANAQGLALIAADRTLNAARIAFMVAAAVAGNVQSTGAGGLVDLTTNLASNAADYRQTYGMGRDAVLDVVLPHWVEQALYADSIARDSTTGVSNVGWLGRIFAELNLRPQFVYDLDDQTNGLFEAEANVLMYAPGTVVELDGGTLDLGVVRDSTLNATNDYQVFTEPFTGWCVPGHEIRSLTIPVCATGGTGDRVAIACPPAS